MARDDDRPRRSRDEDDEPRSRRRDSDDDRGGSRRGRDEDDRGSRKGRDDDDAPRRGGRDRDDDDRGSRSGGGSFRYERRDAGDVKERQEKQQSGDFDRIVKDGLKQFKANDGDNRIRIMPPTWKGAKHYGFDLYVNYGVGPDKGTYLSLHKMKGEKDPIWEAYDEARQDLNRNEEDKDLKEYVRNLKPKARVGIFLVDRDNEKEGVQFWAMPQGLDADIVQVMQDKATGEVLNIDDPEEGYDVEFRKKGKAINTEYLGVAIARRSSPLGRKGEEWLGFVQENPIPEILNYHSYEHIAKAFGGKGGQSKGRDSDDRDPPRRSRDEGDDRSRGRDDDRGGRGREDDPPRRSRDRDDDRDERPARRQKDEPTWESVHAMTRSELEDLVDQEKLDVKPSKAEDDADLADWVCEELKLKKPEKPERRREKDDDESDDKLRKMRDRRERD